jgi:hypothetical protein
MRLTSTVPAGKISVDEALFTIEDSPFIIIYKATAKGNENKIFAANKNQIIWAELEDDGNS